MPTLYEIEQAMLACVDPETGEIIDCEALDALKMEKEAKLEGVALWIKNLSADIAAFEAEISAFEKRKRAADNKVKGLKNWLAYALNGGKFKSAKCVVTCRTSEKVDVKEGTVLPPELTITKTEIKPDKAAIKDAIKAGQIIDGCTLITNISASVK